MIEEDLAFLVQRTYNKECISQFLLWEKNSSDYSLSHWQLNPCSVHVKLQKNRDPKFKFQTLF